MPIEFGPPPAQVQPFQIQPVQYTDPLETLARMQQMKTQNIQQQQAQLGLQVAQQQMASNKAMMDAFVNGGGDTAKTRQLMVQSGQVLPNDLIGFDNHVLKRDTDMATLTEKQNTIRNNQADLYNGILNANGGPGDLGELNARNTRARAGGVPEDMLMTKYPVATPDHSVSDQFKAWGNGLLLHTQQTSQAEKEAQIAQQKAATEETQTKTQKDQRDLAASALRGKINPDTGIVDDLGDFVAIQRQYPQVKDFPTNTKQNLENFIGSTVKEEERPKYLLSQRELELMNAYKGNPQSLQARINQSIDPVKYPDLNRRAVNEAQNQVSYEGLNKVIEKYAGLASEQEKTIATETSPQVIAARVGQAVATERATAPLKVAQEIQKQTQLAALSPGGFANIYNPQERTRAETEYNKISQEYGDKAGSAQGLQDFITAAQSGNKAAPGLIPIATVRQFVNRVNRQELESVSGAAGNAWDRLQGFFGKYTEGQPIPPAVLKDLNTISGIMENAAYRTYSNKVDILNQSHGLSGDKAIQPVRRIEQLQAAAPPRPKSIPADAIAQYSATRKQWRYSTDKGKTWQTVNQ